MAVWTKGSWQAWWRSDAAPERWRAPHNTVADAVEWRRASAGVEWGELRLAGVGGKEAAHDHEHVADAACPQRREHLRHEHEVGA